MGRDAEGWGLRKRVPSPIGVGPGEKAVPLTRKFFLTFWLKIVHFGVNSDKNSQLSIVFVNSKYY